MIFNKLFFVTLCCFGISSIKSAKELPPYFPRCYRDRPDLNSCILKATDQVRPYLQRGVPELNIPKISPFIIPELSLNLGANSIDGQIVCTNASIIGLDTYKFTKFDFDPEKLAFDTALDMDKISVITDFVMTGKILTIPLHATGHIHGVVDRSNGTLFQTNRLIKKKGVSFIDPVDTVVHLKFGPSHIKEVKNLKFANGENLDLQKALTRAIEDNSEILMDEMRPAVEELMTQIILEILLKSIFRVPYDKLYPKSP